MVIPSTVDAFPIFTFTGTLSPGCTLLDIFAFIWNTPGMSVGTAPAY